MNRNSIFIYILLCFLCSFLVAQEDTERTLDWVVRVVLRNNSEIKGVVLNNCFVENVVPGSRIYLPSKDIKAEGAGIRIWYVKSSPGFVFLPYIDVLRVVKLEKLSAKTKAAMEEAIKMKLERVMEEDEEHQRKWEEELKEQGISLTIEEELERLKLEEERRNQPPPEIDKEAVMRKLPPNAQEILKRFPPDQGWSEARYQQYKPRVARASQKKGNKKFEGIPTDIRQFIYNYIAWRQAYDMYKMLAQRELLRLTEKAEEEAKLQEMEDDERWLQSSSESQEDLEEQKLTPEDELTEDSKTLEESQEEKIDRSKNRDQVQTYIHDLIYTDEIEGKIQAMQELGNLGEIATKAFPSIRLLLKHQDPKIQVVAIQTLAKIQEPKEEIAKCLGEALELGSMTIRLEAAKALQTLGKHAASQFFRLTSAATLDEEAEIRFICLQILETIEDQRAITYIQTRLWDSDLSVQIAAISALLTLVDNVDSLDQWTRTPLLQGLRKKDEKISILSSKCFIKMAEKLQTLTLIKQIKQSLSSNVAKYLPEVQENITKAIEILDKVILENEQKQQKLQEETQETQPRVQEPVQEEPEYEELY